MKNLLSVFALVSLILATSHTNSQGVITHTTSADFNKGNLNNVFSVSDNVVLPYQSDGFSINWTSTTNLPDKRSNHKVSFWNNRVYLTGGMEFKGYSGGQEVVACSPSVYMADVGTGIGTWTALDSIPYGISDHSAIIMNGFLYVIGGKMGENPTDIIKYTKIMANGTLEGWQSCTAVLPQPMWGMTAEFVNGYLVIAGGSIQADKFTATNTVYTALVEPDGDIETFVAQPSLPEALNQHTMMKYGNALYVMGGYDNSGLVKSTVYYTTIGLTGNCDTWQLVGSFPQAVYGHSSTCYNGIITIMGGYSDTTGNAIAQCYFAKIDNSPSFSWLSGYYYPIHLAFADAFVVNSKIFCLGGFDVFENTRQEVNYNNLVMSATVKVRTGVYLSPLINLVSNTQINQLSYNVSNLTNCAIYYRHAESGGTWSNWVNTSLANPVPLSINKRYFQYMFSFENAPTNNFITLNDVTLSFNASTFAGTLSGNLHWTLPGSPYICTSDAILTSGTLTIDLGVTVLFMNETGLEVGGATVQSNGTSDQPVLFSGFSGERGAWDGVYFNSSSNAYSSYLNYTIFEMAGFGTRQANLYCSNTNKPAMDHCTIRYSSGNGLYLLSSSPNIQNTAFYGNIIYGISIKDDSFPQLTNISIFNNLLDGIVVLGGTISSSGIWVNAGYNYIIWDNIIISNSARLTIAAGDTIRTRIGKNISVGNTWGYPNGELYAIGKVDSMIVFTSYNNAIGGWEGLSFNSYSGNPMSSLLNNCIVEKGNQYNLCSTSDQPVIDNCIFRLSASDGIQVNGNIVIYNSIIENNADDGIQVGGGSPEFDNVIVQNNGGHGFNISGGIHTGIINSTIQNNTGHGFCMNPGNSPEFYNVTFTGNLTNNEIIVLGGTATNSTLWRFEGMDYVIWDNIIISNSARLTIAAGDTIRTRIGKNISVGNTWGYPNGELYAIGKADSIIVFTSYNNAIGGWEGLSFNSYSGNPMSSLLNNCIVEKGNQYNLCSTSDQPEIDSCIFRLSANYGISLSNSSVKLKKSQVIFNNTNGIYITGSSNPVIGNTDSTGCDLFGNGIYDIYNNSANNIPAEYNFWNSLDSTFIAGRIYDKYDNSAMGYVLPYNPADSGLQILSLFDIYGRISYDNNGSTGLKNSVMHIKSLTGDTLSSSPSNLNGYYLNCGFENGTYITCPGTTVVWGGVNATDALKIMRHYAMLETLTGLRKKAADVNASSSINSTDAMQVLQRYTYMINSFASGDWYFEQDTVTIASYSVESNMKGICFGDVNGSFLPFGAKGSEIELIYEGSLITGSFEEIELPVKVKKPLHAAAISLGFYFPEEYLQIDGVSLGNGNTNIVWSSENGLLKMAWSQIEPYILGQDEILLNLQISTKDLSGLTEPITLQLFEDVEIADENAQAIEEVILSIPVIEAFMTGTPENWLPSASIYPNPLSSKAVVTCTLPCMGTMDIQIYDVLGNLQETLEQKLDYPGKHSIPLKLSNYAVGVYFINMNVKCNGQEYFFKEKIIVQH